MHQTLITIALTLLVVILISFILYYYYHHQPKCHIFTATETTTFLQSDEDGYIRSLTQADLHARNAHTHEEYIRNCSSSSHDASHDELKTIYTSIAQVDRFLRSNPNIPISCAKLNAIPWKIAITQGRKYENGYPHTRMDVILIDESSINDPDFVATLLHEKVHIYQRKYSEDVYEWLAKTGYKRSVLRSSYPLARANPDLDQWVYIDPTTKKEMVALYNSAKPKSISDVQLVNYAFEHPFEYLAYQIGDLLKDRL